MADRIIQTADLSGIERSLSVMRGQIQAIDANVETVNQNVRVVFNQVEQLADEFRTFVQAQILANRLGQAETKLIKIRQELEKKYGHYDQVRRTATGILQADDLGVVKKDTITTVAEELMLSTPNYWLAPCLVALAAWIDNQPELAEKALREGIKRNDEKTSLFFALVCRRAGRKDACLKWTRRYLENQNEEELDRKTVIILDAYASGLLGNDSEGVVSHQIGQWMEYLTEKPGFVEQQTTQWSEAINLKRKAVDDSAYPYLRKYSKTWPVLEDILEGACLHAEILSYFTSIFEQQASTASVKAQLDEILTSLVTDFDDEELPLRQQEKFEQFVVDFKGDEDRARQNMQIEQTAFETHKDFTQLLTDAAMKPESAHASPATQKFAIALSRDWISTAYSDVVAQNRMKIPDQISIHVDTFNGVTRDGQNEDELIGDFAALVDQEKERELAKNVLSGFAQFCLWGGGAIAAVGIGMLVAGQVLLGLIAVIAGAGLVINHFSQKKNVENSRSQIAEYFEKKRTNGIKVIRAMLAEVVDFRREFAERDAESQKVIDFLEEITPDQYVRNLSGSRRIKV